MPYSYKAALEKLGDPEKNRMVAIFLSKDEPTADYTAADWKKATTAYGSASVESMKKTLTNSLKKIVATDEEDDAAAVPTTTTTAKKNKGGRPLKRKAETTDDNVDEAEQPASPVKKRGRGRPAKAKAVVKTEEDVEKEAGQVNDDEHVAVDDVDDDKAEKDVPPTVKRGRGRPPKASSNAKGKGKKTVVKVEEVVAEEVGDVETGEQSKDEELETEAQVQADDEA